jgi:hypothetical protein
MHYHRFRRVPLSFVGSDAVTALAPPSGSKAQAASTSSVLPRSSVTSMASSRGHAVFILQCMIDAGHVSCVVGNGAFHDDASIYRSAPIV